MFERFADGARSAVVAAQQEAIRVCDPRIEASHLLIGAAVAADEPLRVLLEHILLGLLRSDDPATGALVEAHVPRAQLRQRLSGHLDAAA